MKNKIKNILNTLLIKITPTDKNQFASYTIVSFLVFIFINKIILIELNAVLLVMIISLFCIGVYMFFKRTKNINFLLGLIIGFYLSKLIISLTV